jgi:hypothetical protein
MFSYGDFFFGDGSTDDEGNLTGQFITYQKKDGDTKKKLHINADVTFGSNSEGLSNLKEWSGLAGTVEEMQTEIDNAVTDLVKVNSTLGNLQDQIDGVVENYFLEGMPTINNVPVTDWKGESEDDDNALLNHVGDTYTDITEYIDDETTPTAGKSWRWCECNSHTIENEVVGPASYYSGDNWVKIGTVPIKDYGSAVLRRNGTICSRFFSFAYNTEIRNNIGRPAYLKVEKSTGDVYIQNFANALDSGSYQVQLYVGAVMAQKSDASVVNLHWHPIADSDAVKALLEAAKAQDTANNKRRVFTDSPKGPYDKGDLWAQGGTGELMVCVNGCSEVGQFFSSDWDKATKYTDDSALTEFLNGDFKTYKEQVDNKVDTFYEGTDPSTSWDDKASHKGDLWYKDGKNYIYNGTASEFIEGVPQSLYDNVDRKKQVFYEQLTTPYEVGDLWAQGEGGDIMICKNPKVSGNFDASDWVKASNYTDGSNTKNLIPNSRVIKSFRLPQEHYPTGDSTLYYAKIILPIRVNAGETYTFKCEKSKILSGSQTGYRIRIDDGTTGEDGVTNAYSTWGNVSVGDKKYTTITILEGVTNKVAYLSIVRQGPYGNSKSDSIVLNNVSLVRGNNPMPVWEDYQGDVGLKNLIDRHPSDAATIVGETQYSNWDFAHLTVNGGESYTFMAESALATNDTGFNIGLYADNKWINEETWPIYIKNGTYVYGTLNVANTVVTKSPARQTTISVPAFNNKSQYHIGTIELKEGREYSSISYKRGDVYMKDVNFALDTDIQISSGPPTYIRIESATGNVYILDQHGYHTQVSLALIFTYTDSTTETIKNKEVKLLVYAGQTPTNGKTLTIKNFSLVKGTTPLMVWKENTDYLTNAFKNGTTTVTGGLVMTQAVMVEDGSGNVKGMLNGSDFAKDEEHGKIILAGGVPKTSQSGSSVLETRVKEATTRIYDDGHINAIGGEFNDVKINGSISSPFVLWRKFDITDSSSGKVHHRYPAGDANNRYAWIHYNSDGSTLLRYTNSEMPTAGSALYGSSTGSQVAVAINCTAINVFDGNANVKTKHDNIVLPKTTASSSSSESNVSGYEINAEDFSWGVENSGRIIRLNNYKWGATIAYGKTIIKAPSGKYFYENGRQHSQLMISRECVELLGYGTSSVFYGWIVLNRQNVLTVGYYGMPLNVLFQGIFIPQSPYLERVWSAELMTTGITETWNIKILATNGKYRIYLPMYFSSMSSFHVMLTPQVKTLSGGAISGAPDDNVFACICGKGNEVVNGKTLTYFDVAVGDDDTLNPGGFLFQVISTADWSSPTATAEEVSAIDDDLGDVPVKSGNDEIYNPGVIVNVIPNE